MTDIERDQLYRFGKMIHERNVSNAFLVQIIELAGCYLDLRTIPKYAKDNSLSYNGVKKTREIITLFNCKFVLDNA